MTERLIVGMSGGVDSSVAAALLVEQGYDVVGVTLRVWPWRAPEEGTKRFGSCCSPETVAGAREVARKLAIPYYVLNTEREFDAAVIEEFTREYAAGRTPVPCVACNRKVKFGSLLARARAWDAVGVATSHYARVTRDAGTGRHLLWRGRDARKDQSDFLWPLTQDQLAAARFPWGRSRRTRCARRPGGSAWPPPRRRRARRSASSRTTTTADSCDAGRPKSSVPGPSWMGRGGSSGAMGGLRTFTVGQRRGLGLATGQSLYVTALDPDRNAVVVGPAQDLRDGQAVGRGREPDLGGDARPAAHRPGEGQA